MILSFKHEKILLVVLPFWDPLIPPMGISCLHGFLTGYGYPIRKVDANTEKCFTEIYDGYLQTLKQYIPAGSRGNFYNIVKNVLREHMLAHINYEDESEYSSLVKLIVFNTFFYRLETGQVLELNRLVEEFYRRLKVFFLKLLAEEQPEVVGISVIRGTLAASLYAFRLAKENNPRTRTIMGGGIFADQLAPGSPGWERFLEKTPFIDHMIIGEGELLFLKYLQHGLPEKQRVYTLADINNRILDISSLGVPDFSGFDLRYYVSLGAYTSRSCPYQCSFCSETLQWGKYRKKKAKQVAVELKTLYDTYGMRLFLMSDSLLNPVIDDLARELTREAVSLYWDGYLRVDRHAADRQRITAWREGGVYRARLGVESGSGRVLELMNKKITPAQTREALQNLANAGIKTTTYWIIGFPGETEEDFQQTLDLIEAAKNDIYEADFNSYWYYPGGQVKSGEWRARSKLLYPGSMGEMLIFPPRYPDVLPSREETFQRLNRICELCSRLRIPNPYSMYDIYKADERWEKLHKNAVPSILKLKDKHRDTRECKRVTQYFPARDTREPEGDWGF